MAEEADAIEQLHQQLFGFTPRLPGTAYERITAIVLAVLGWTEIQRASREQPEGARAKQTIDVVARNPAGEQRRLIVQCKHYGKRVGKEVMDTLVGIGKQLGDIDLAVVTTVGFKKGAMDVAHDEDVAMIQLRPYDPAQDDGQFIRQIVITIKPVMPPVITAFNLETGPTEGPVIEGPQGSYDLDTRLQRNDGSPAETLRQLMYADTNTFEPGEFDRRVEPTEARWVALRAGRVKIQALAWHEAIHAGDPVTTESSGEGEPMLVIQQLDSDGNVASGRLVVDRHLYAWDLDSDNNVIPRGPLTDDDPTSP
jgi:hypothetical protein